MKCAIALGYALMMVLALSACGASAAGTSAPPQQTKQPMNTPAPLQIALQVDRMMIESPQDLCDVPLTAEVVVGTHGTARWNTPDGKRPNIATASEAISQGYFIYAPVTFASMTVLHDSRAGASVAGPTTSITLGGQVGQDSYSVAEQLPQLEQPNARYIVALGPLSPPTRGLPAGDVLLVTYAFPVDASGIVTLRPKGDPNEPGPGQPDPGLTISLGDLKQALASC